MEDRNGVHKTHSTISKKARGAFLTAVMQENCQTIYDLRKLSFDVKKSLNQGEVVIWDKLNDGQTNYEQVDRKDML